MGVKVDGGRGRKWEGKGDGRSFFGNLETMYLLYFCCTFFNYWLEILNQLRLLNDQKIRFKPLKLKEKPEISASFKNHAIRVRVPHSAP